MLIFNRCLSLRFDLLQEIINFKGINQHHGEIYT